MSKFCLMTFSFVGSSPALVSPAKSSGSLPPSQLPIFLPAMLLGSVILAGLNDAIRVPERWKIWAIKTRSVPPSRAWSMFGSPAVPVVTLVDRGVVARELRLGDPLELEFDRRQHGQRSPAGCAAAAGAARRDEHHRRAGEGQHLSRESHVDRSSSSSRGRFAGRAADLVPLPDAGY